MEKWRLVIYCPAYNVGKSIAELVERTAMQRKALSGMGASVSRMVVVNDGSTDATGAILRKLAKKHRFLSVVEKKRNEGPASAVFSGMEEAARAARALPARTIIIRMDSDLEHQPEDISRVIKPIVSGKCRISVGYLPLDSRNGHAAMLFSTTIGLAESREFLGLGIPQFAPGFNATRADLFLHLLPGAKRRRRLFMQKAGKDMLTIDFVYLALAREAGERISAVRLSPIEDKWIKKVPAGKMLSYLRYHLATSEFLRSFKN